MFFKNINFFSQNQQRAFLEILKDDILQLNFHTFIGSWTQFEELHGPFVNLRAHLPPKHNSPKEKYKIENMGKVI